MDRVKAVKRDWSWPRESSVRSRPGRVCGENKGEARRRERDMGMCGIQIFKVDSSRKCSVKDII